MYVLERVFKIQSRSFVAKLVVATVTEIDQVLNIQIGG